MGTTIRVLNKHTSSVDEIPPGAVGEVDPANPAIASYLRAELLVPLSALERRARAEAAPEGEAPAEGPTRQEGLAMVAELERRAAHIAELKAELAEAKKASKGRGKGEDKDPQKTEG